MNTESLRTLKQSASKKLNQGDVRIYALGGVAIPDGVKSTDPVIVYGASGNHHKLTGTEFVRVDDKESGATFVRVDKAMSLSHEQHKPPHRLAPGVYLFTRAREKNLLTDLVAPVAD